MKKSELENNEDYVECKDCGHIVAKGRAQKIEVLGYSYLDVDWSVVTRPSYRYYCELHKKAYDEINMSGFFKKMEVSEDGTPIGYKKITPKK